VIRVSCRRIRAKEKMRYFDKTFNDKNPVKRFLQRRRLDDALSVLDGLREDFSGRVLDFGGGSGELSAAVAGRFPRAEVLCYEPTPSILQEAEQNLSGVGNATPAGSLRGIGGGFDYVFCLEVFEHLPPRQTARVVRRVRRLLRDGGTFVVGVPNELFLSALFKGLFRMTRRYGAFDERTGNVLRAAIGRPPEHRPVKRIAAGLPYHFHHTGFDHRELRALLSDTFEVVRQFGSPLRSELASSEVYLILKAPDRGPRP
jgi:SAM-dependent methyltransferase